MKLRLLMHVTVLGTVIAIVPYLHAQAEPRPPAAPPPANRAKIDRVSIRTVLATQVAEWNRGNIDAFMEGYWNSPDTEFVGANGILRGWQTVLERYRKQYPDRAAMGHLTFSDLDVNLLAPDAALVVGRWQLKRENDSPGGVFTLVFRKFPEGWRIINDHTSQTPNP